MNEQRIPLKQLNPVQAPTAPEVPVVEPDTSRVGPGRQVSLNFALSLESGEDIENNLQDAPLNCVIGDGSLLPGFEDAMHGMRAGDSLDVVLAPEQAFGQPNEDNVQRFPLYRFPPDMELAKGLMLSFDGKGDYSQTGVVQDFDKHYVTIDFNHPLAGRRLRFRVRLHAVE